MIYFKSYTIVLFLFAITATAQQKISDTTQIDSLYAATVKKQLNKLPVGNYQHRVYQNKSGTIPYRFLTPKNFDQSVKYPLVITFHNSSRIGTDNENQLEPLARIWVRDTIYSTYKCFVLAPQFNRRSSNYTDTGNGLAAKPSDEVALLFDLIRKIEQEYPNIDHNRIYLVGYSMGASTAQNLFSLNPDQFAALVSIAGVPDLSNTDKLASRKIWLIHGEKDDENPYQGSEILFRRLKGNKKLLFTSFPNLNHHNIMIPFLLTDVIPEWLFKDQN